MIGAGYKSFRDYSIGEWLFLAIAAGSGCFLGALLPQTLRLGNMPIGFWVFLIAISTPLAYVNRPRKQLPCAIPAKSWTTNSWAALATIPVSFIVLPASAVLSYVLVRNFCGNSIVCFVHSFWLFCLFVGLYFLCMSGVMFCERLQLSFKDLLNLSPSYIHEIISKRNAIPQQCDRSLKLNYPYHDSMQLALASLGVLKSFQVKHIDENMGQVLAVSGYKSLNNEFIAMQLQQLPDGQTLVSIRSTSSDGRFIPMEMIMSYLNEFNHY